MRHNLMFILSKYTFSHEPRLARRCDEARVKELDRLCFREAVETGWSTLPCWLCAVSNGHVMFAAMRRGKPLRLTIEDLSRESGVTTRNIRSFQYRGILQAPELEGRIGYYGDLHVRRLELVQKLQERGFSLAAIAELVAASKERRSVDDVLGLADALKEPWSKDKAVRVTVEDLVNAYPGVTLTKTLIDRLQELEILEPDTDGFLIRSPRLLKVGGEMSAAGVPVEAALDELEKLRAQMNTVAMRFANIFLRFVLPPHQTGEKKGVGSLTTKLKGLRSIAFLAVEVTLEMALSERIAELTTAGNGTFKRRARRR